MVDGSIASPEISVLVPVGQGVAAYLAAGLDSMASQAGPSYEVLLVDDRMDEESRRVISSFDDSRFQLLACDGEGLVDALNTGLAAARGRILVRFDADDVARPGRLAAQAQLLDSSPEVGLVGTRVALLEMTEGSPGYRRFVEWQNGLLDDAPLRRARFAECPIAHPTFALRTAQLRNLGGYSDHSWPEDLDLLCRVVEAGFALAKLPEVFHDWRDRPDRLSRVDSRYGREAFLRCKAHYLARALPGLAEGRDLLVWGAGRVGGRLGRLLLEHGVPLTGFVDIDPRKIGGTRHGLPILDGRGECGESLEEAFILAAVGGEGGRVLEQELRRRALNWLPAAGP